MVEYIEKDKAIEAVENIVCSMSVCMNIDEYKAKRQMKEMAVAKLKRMPPTQPEIIRCKDCENWDTSWQNDWAKDYHYCLVTDGTHRSDWYCADAERRTDD